MAPEFLEKDSLHVAVIGARAFKHNDIVNRANNSKLLSTKMDIALYPDEDATDEHGGFYKLQRSKRVSTANLKSLTKRQGDPGSDNLLCSPVEEKFTTNLDILEEMSEPDTPRSEGETREPSTAGPAAQADAPVQSPARSEPYSSLTHRISQSQDRLNRLLEELDRTTKRFLPHAGFTSNIVDSLRPHFKSMNHIASHLEPPTDKWSAFVHYIAWLGVDSSLKEADRARAGAIAQLGYALDRWQPKPSGPGRWAARMQQACNVWQDTLHDLQCCSFRDGDGETLDPKEREELSKVVGMEDLARALCVHAMRFGDKWEDNRRRYIEGEEDVGGGDGLEGGRGELVDIREKHSTDSFTSARSHLKNPEAISKAHVEHELTEENLRALSRRYCSMPSLNPVEEWVVNLPRRIPKQGPGSQAVVPLVDTPSSNLTESTISQVRTKTSKATHPYNEQGEFPSEAPLPSQSCERSSRTTIRADIHDRSAAGEAPPSTSSAKQWKLIALSRPLTVRGSGLPTPDSSQSWQQASSEGTSTKASSKAKQMWQHLKRYVKEHHESANATVAAHYGQGSLGLQPDTNATQVEEIKEEGQDYVARHAHGSEANSSATDFPLLVGSIPPRPPRPRPPSTAFSDLQSYRSDLSDSYDSVVDEYGPVTIPPRALSTADLFAELKWDSSSFAESLYDAQEHSPISGGQFVQVRDSQGGLVHSVKDDASVLQTSHGMLSVDPGSVGGSKWTAPSVWNRSPPRSLSGTSPAEEITDIQERERIDEEKKERKEDKRQKYAELMERRLVAHGLLAKER
ncbi:uncharacterized protein N0V89_004657 [Didymosphaeria variabile]|uniref:Uncharacterized protein n=1 Tax=Didymosphaeria variabile TaxID=1932322 RepID=A0A9W9CDS7_9PLEO|nr:uncharacterized protein N0V89_004657 [Didymosphaeria variabile]KAJ4356621.1 hypothetical protein N0V89_004657 [Didymosphaeria variabile]